MIVPIKKYRIELSNSDKAELFDRRREIAKVFLAPTLFDLDKAITPWFSTTGLQEVLNTLDFIPCVREAEIAYMQEQLSEVDLRSYMDDIIATIKNMRTADLYHYTFDDYKAYSKKFNVPIVDTLGQFTDSDEIIEWITSDDRLEDFGEKLREEFCKWLSEK